MIEADSWDAQSMDDNSRRQQQRFKFLKYLYDNCGGRAHHIAREQVRQALGLSATEAAEISAYLAEEGLTEGTVGLIGLTHKGVKEVEAALTEPAKPTDHFPVNVINIGQGSSIHIQQGTINSSQSSSVSRDTGPSTSGEATEVYLDETDQRVLRYLEQKWIATGGGNFIMVSPDDIKRDNGLEDEQYIRMIARFRRLGIVRTAAADGSLFIQEIISHYVEELDRQQKAIAQQAGVDMDVLISWSKGRSREVATLFHGWLPKVLPGVAPWMSDKDIDKGTEWFAELQGLLGRAKLCIICVTAENVRSPWLYYETGAIAAKNDEHVRVCPYLIGIEPSMLSDGPLGKWQCTVATKADTLALLRSLNKVLDEGKRHHETLLEGNFEAKWPEFEKEFVRILALDLGGGDAFIATEADQFAGYNLSSEARTLLLEAVQDANGLVLFVLRRVQTNGHTLNADENQRSDAKWKQALSDLVEGGLVEPRGYQGNTFAVTAKGYEVADLLKG